MSNIEIIEEYRAMAVQEAQRAQFLHELLVGVLADGDPEEPYIIEPSAVQEANANYTLSQRLNDDGHLVLELEEAQ